MDPISTGVYDTDFLIRDDVEDLFRSIENPVLRRAAELDLPDLDEHWSWFSRYCTVLPAMLPEWAYDMGQDHD